MPHLGEIAGLITAICWSLTSIVFTIASRRIGALQVNLYRLPAAIFLLGITYFLFWGNLNVSGEVIFWLATSGVVGLAIGDTFLFQAMVIIGARLSMILMALAPPMAALLAYIFLGEIISPLGIVGIAVTIAGVIWVVAERTPDPGGIKQRISLKGVLWGILAALGQAVGLILAKKGLNSDIHALLATLIRMLGATAILWPITLLSRKVKNPIRIFSNDRSAIKYMILGIIFGPYLGVTLSLVSVKYTQTGIAATLMSTVPVIMIPMVIAIEKEKVSRRAILGATIAVTGIAILFLR
ncbi:MAG: DMT family transporter [Calditrichota bacterium]